MWTPALGRLGVESMKRIFIFVGSLILFSVLLISCSNFNIFKDITFGSDMKNVEKILSQNKIKYKTYPAAPMLDIDLENPEEIADALRNKSAGLLGDMLYKESIYYLKSICGINFQSQIFFFNDKCTNISLRWHIKSNPSLKNGYIASEKLRTYITQQYPEKKFEPAEDKFHDETYVMQISDTVSISVRANTENLYCDMEDSVLQEPYEELKKKVKEFTDYYGNEDD